MNPLLHIFSFFSASKFIFKLIAHQAVLRASLQAISDVLMEMKKTDRVLPSENEATLLLMGVSNILKTGVVDLPGFDEYELSIQIDRISNGIVLSIQDQKDKKYHDIAVFKKEVLK